MVVAAEDLAAVQGHDRVELFAREEFAELIAFWVHRGFTVDRPAPHGVVLVKPLPHAVRGITQTLAEFQRLTAEAAWGGTRADAVRALTAHPFVRNLHVAEELYDDLAYANRDYLPERLLR